MSLFSEWLVLIVGNIYYGEETLETDAKQVFTIGCETIIEVFWNNIFLCSCSIEYSNILLLVDRQCNVLKILWYHNV